jgi:DNA-binding NarL/FixJ family response regulator
MGRPRVLIADDHQVLAEGLRSILEPEFEVVGIVSDGREMLAAAREQQPDVIVADVSMPSLNGIDAAMQLRESGNRAKVVFLTMHCDVAYARLAMEAGATGYVLKHSVASEVVTAIHQAMRGNTYVTPSIAGELLGSYRNGSPGRGAGLGQLTGRQREVLQLVAEGRSAKEIAATLGISTRTAEAHKAKLLAVLGLESTAQLVQFAIRNGLLSV